MTADILDATQEIEQKLLDSRIAAIRQSCLSRKLQPKQECHWCHEPFEVNSQKLFCDQECGEDHAKYERQH